MFHSSRTTLRELKKRYLSVLKKCFLLNMGMILISTSAISGTATDTASLMTELEKNERTVVETGTHILTYDKTSSLYDAETNSIIFPNIEHISKNIKVEGGRLYNNADLTFISDNELIFKENKSILTNGQGIYGGAINNAGNLTFNAKVGFLENENSSNNWIQGTVHNSGTINFNNYVRFEDNISLPLNGTVYGSAVYNSGTLNFASADFIANYSGTEENQRGGNAAAIHNKKGGNITFSGIVNFEDNQGWGSIGHLSGGTVFNAGGIEFQQKASFKNNSSTVLQGQYQSTGNFYNTGTVVFADVDFIGNKVTGSKSGQGSALFNTGNLIFKGSALFQNNTAEAVTKSVEGGVMYLQRGTAVFEKEALFLNNSADAVTSASAGAIYVGHQDSILTFQDKATFLKNKAKGDTVYGGAIYITSKNSILTFENGFHFEENKEVVTTINEDGSIIETERLNDIYVADGTINIEGTNADAVEYIGGGIRGVEGMGTINKSSVATLVFGEESDSSRYTGVFNQTAGKTVASSETFLGGTNNILGDELETHGSEILYTAVVGQNKDETTGEVLSSGTLTHLALGSAPIEIKGLSFKEEGTNLSMTFKSGTTERGKYQINEDIMNATGNKLAFENSELALADNIKVSGTIEAKNSDIDVGTREISVDEISLKENAVLKMTVNSLDEHGKVNGVITGTDTSKIALQLGIETESGIYQLFDRDNEVKTVGNPLFNIQDIEDGSFEISKKTAEELSSSLSVGKNEGKALSAMIMRSAPNKEFKVVQEEVLEALQSEDKATVEKAKQALNALGGRSTSLYQSQATAGFTQLHNVVSQMLMNTAAPVFGHAGGEEPARASVYIKGLYDRVNSLTGDGFRMRSKGAVLGVQSALTEDLTIGVGYAGVDTTAKEPLRRTEVKTNTGFVSAQYQPNNWWVNGVVTYSRSQYDEEKHVLSSTGESNYDVDSIGAQITTGYNIKKSKVIVTPEVGIRYLNTRQEGYTDSLGTTVEATNSDFVTAMVGFKVGADLGWVRPLAGVMVGYDVITDDISSVNTLANGATYTINGKALDRLSTTAVAGFGMDIGENATLKLEYNGNYRKEYLDHSGMIRLEMKF